MLSQSTENPLEFCQHDAMWYILLKKTCQHIFFLFSINRFLFSFEKFHFFFFHLLNFNNDIKSGIKLLSSFTGMGLTLSKIKITKQMWKKKRKSLILLIKNESNEKRVFIYHLLLFLFCLLFLKVNSIQFNYNFILFISLLWFFFIIFIVFKMEF